MGLSADLEKVLMDNLSDAGDEKAELDPFVEDKIKQLAGGLSKSIINWVQAQTFTITELKSIVELESVKTTGPMTTELPIATAGPPGAPIAVPGQPFLTLLNLGKMGGQGGAMMSKGYAYIGKSHLWVKQMKNKLKFN